MREETGIRPQLLKALEGEGLVRISKFLALARGRGAAPRGEAAHEPTPAQRGAIERLLERVRLGSATSLSGAGSADDRRPVLLHGVTGSGKTLVYLRLVERALAAGGSAIVLVPEIGSPACGGALPRGVRDRCAAPQRPLGRRASRGLAGAADGQGARRGRAPIGRLRPAIRCARDRGGRGARGELQTGGGSPYGAREVAAVRARLKRRCSCSAPTRLVRSYRTPRPGSTS